MSLSDNGTAVGKGLSESDFDCNRKFDEGGPLFAGQADFIQIPQGKFDRPKNHEVSSMQHLGIKI